MNQHTPGPWIRNPAPEPQNADRHICVNVPSGFARVIARVKHTDVDNALANARLIAKAPELYERLMAEPCGCLRGSAGLTQTCSRCTLIREIDGPIQI